MASPSPLRRETAPVLQDAGARGRPRSARNPVPRLLDQKARREQAGRRARAERLVLRIGRRAPARARGAARRSPTPREPFWAEPAAFGGPRCGGRGGLAM